MKTALLSVSDKTGIVEFAKYLQQLGWRIISTGGTHKLLEKEGVKDVVEVGDFTGFPEGLDGRIKTLTPQVFGGILSLRGNKEHESFCKENKLEAIDMVVVNLYPFKEAYYNQSKDFEEKVEQIDIGGPSMIRAAAKNYEYCLPIVDPSDYTNILQELEKHSDVSLNSKKKLAAKVFAMTSHYDLLIARFWEEEAGIHPLRYGENPHQQGVIVQDPFTEGANLAAAEILNGKPLSYNNFNDASGALDLALSFDKPFAAVIKHATPCGAAVGKDIDEAFQKAYEADPVSAFGGIIAVNKKLTVGVAQRIISFFNEIVIAPDYEPEALEVLKTKPNLRVLKIKDWNNRINDLSIRKVSGGTLIQDLDTYVPTEKDLEVATSKAPSTQQMEDLLTAWNIVKIVKSNAIVIVKDGVMIGKGGGQTSRVEATEIALHHAGDNALGAVLASDAFFPFADSIQLAAERGIAAIIQPGGSRKDDEVIDAANKLKIPMVLTGTRAFLH